MMFFDPPMFVLIHVVLSVWVRFRWFCWRYVWPRATGSG